MQVAIIGRPNVGKSALFNRFSRCKLALVHNTPEGHVTRDYRRGVGKLADLRFMAVDTSGLEPFMAKGSIQERATRITLDVVRRCDLALLLVDARSGLVPEDEALVAWLRKCLTAPVLLAANKAERRGRSGVSGVSDALSEATRLGLGEPVAISAETGEGLVDLYTAMQPMIDKIIEERASQREEAAPKARSPGLAGEDDTEGPQDMKIAVIGQPNVGKSTLCNYLLGRERSLTGPEPGLTRDAVAEDFEWEGHAIELVDSAGWIRDAKLPEDGCRGAVAGGALRQAEHALNFAQVVVLMVDAAVSTQLGAGLTRRELALASSIVREGRALIIALNKLDLLSPLDRDKVVGRVEEQVKESLPEVAGVPCIGVSALTGAGAGEVLPTALQAFRVWNQRVPTARLNRWLIKAGILSSTEYRGTAAGRQVMRLRYVTQVSARPPTFAAFISGAEELSDNTTKFILNSLRAKFGFPGVPLRLLELLERIQEPFE
ncbi:small GTP-binding protein [Coccomyxa subellipsoidea C-169]|uniref:GTPase Der n=1 Tax=Coccomyxa subellipsoidea (strain C-169) TaxID=574566 RepID=I0YR86_COCSC|nr:small GTP-binding protein [Coccomyxa subellipsoidea C-169]EIE20905.1 small GTP-binding protein [Coccomyxa subellipsoidea C-169]|eukprot:XP_005645449.1 small GTP-binding protein [Coccomyxa subellipsoidea C-169]